MKKLVIVATAALLCALPAAAQQAKPAADPAKVDAAIKASWSKSTPEWQARLDQDETLKACSAARNSPSKDVAAAIQKREKATIQYPADGKFLGDWKNGEKLAQNGYGGRFTDKDPKRVNGGNCYACHQVDMKEVAYGTVGPSLHRYGKLKQFSEAEVKGVYEKIYNSHSVFPCSNMPRFGANRFLTIDQIKDIVALLMSPDSPVNK